MGEVTSAKLGGVEWEAETLDAEEMSNFDVAFSRISECFNEEGKAYNIYDERDKQYLLAAIMVMKKHFKGARFAGMDPKEGEFGIREPQVEDLVGATDTEWGATTAGTGTWTAGQRGWIQSVAQNAATYAAALPIRLRDSTGSQEWAILLFGVRSYSFQPTVKDILIEIAAAQQATQGVEQHLRGTGLRLAKFDGPFFFHPQRSFKIGVTVRVQAQDQIAPVGVAIIQGTRARDTTYARPTAA
jgi:hypothetical protein